MDEDVLRKLRILAPFLNQLSLAPEAECYYEWLSGGLLWLDEVPDLSKLAPGSSEALRGVLRYRSSLILGEPEEQHTDIWVEAQRLFPKWPGFSQSRRSPELRTMLMDLKAKAVQEMDKMFDD